MIASKTITQGRGLKSNGTKSYAKARRHDRRPLKSCQADFGGSGPLPVLSNI